MMALPVAMVPLETRFRVSIWPAAFEPPNDSPPIWTPAALVAPAKAAVLSSVTVRVSAPPLALVSCSDRAPAALPPLTDPATVTFSPLTLGLRLVLMLAGAACVGVAVRGIAGKVWVERQAERIDGLNVVVLFLFAVALMGDVAANTIARPLFVLGLLALSTAVTFGLSGFTALLFAHAGWHSALPLAHAAGSRNTGLMLAAAAYLNLQRAIIARHGRVSLLASAVGRDVKGKASFALYMLAIAAATFVPWVAWAIYVGVALIWLIPDRRIERTLDVRTEHPESPA